ncbi:MAG: NADH-quinone oxidoreductase subunit N, partial [Bacteroidota bacterium]
YYLLVIKAMLLNNSDQPIARFKSDGYTRLGLLLCVAGMVIIGFASSIYEVVYNLSFGLY